MIASGFAQAILGGFAIAMFVAGSSCAQVTESYFPTDLPGYGEPSSIPVAQRPRPEYEPLGLRIGSDTIRTGLDESFGYDTNPEGLRGGRGSWQVGSSPYLDFDSDHSRYNVGTSLRLTDLRFLDTQSQDRTDFNSTIRGSYQIGRDAISASGSFLSLHEDPTQINSASIRTPLAYTTFDLQTRYTTEIGRWHLEPNIEYLRYRFDNVVEPGDSFNQNTRDRNLYAAGLTLRTGVGENRNVIVSLRTVDANYVSQLGGAPRPNSFAYEALAGIDYTISGNLRFLTLAGYEVRNFSNPAYKSRSTPVTEAEVVWTPDGQTTITGHLSRTVEDSIGTSTTGVTYTRSSLTIDREVRRFWLLQGTAGVEIADYAGSSGSEYLYHFEPSITYLFSRNLRTKLLYDFTSRAGSETTVAGPVSGTTTASGANYNRNIVLLTISLAL